ncbi:MAG: DUF2065 domain-containing protein [Gammaproteobacteria bacterium]|nr:DUF2065 domain-containing protein [Gammaproteobacteria bacterium]
MDWQDLLTALALVLVIEGILPFANPSGMRQAAQLMSALGDRSLRLGGGAAMLAGLFLLYLARA